MWCLCLRLTPRKARGYIGLQTLSVVAGPLIKTFYWLTPVSKSSSLVDIPQHLASDKAGQVRKEEVAAPWSGSHGP